MNITLLVIFCLIYFYASNTSFTFGIGYFSLYRPLVLGIILGIITGNYAECVTVGILLNIMFYDFASTGGSIRFDMSIIMVVAVMALEIFNCNVLQAIAIAFPFGLLGTAIFKIRLKYNGKFASDMKHAFILNENKIHISVIKPQFMLLLISVLMIILINYILILFNNILSINYSFEKYVMQFFDLSGIALIANYFIYFIIKEIKYKHLIFLVTVPMIIFIPKITICLLIGIVIVCMIYDMRKMFMYHSDLKKDSKLLCKKDLLWIWTRWMNLSHASFNTENMQALALNSAMLSLYKKIYKTNSEISKRILDNYSLYNVEPNIGTVAIGYQLNIEEKIACEEYDNNKSESIKKSMMGLVSGLGDSFTQTTLLPMYLGIAICSMQLGYYVFAIASLLLLPACILMYSWNGLKFGYLYDKIGVLKYIDIIKNSLFQKFSKYLIFSCFFIMYFLASGKIIEITVSLVSNGYLIIPIVLVSVIYNYLRKKKYDSIINVCLLYIVSAIAVSVCAII